MDEVKGCNYWSSLGEKNHPHLLDKFESVRQKLQGTVSIFVVKIDLALGQEQILTILKFKHNLNQNFNAWNQILLNFFLFFTEF